MTDGSASSDRERHNENAKNLVLGDGMGMVSSGTVAITDKRHLAVRNAILTHRHGDRKPLAVGGRHLHTDNGQ
jgi:hypothetical protein